MVEDSICEVKNVGKDKVVVHISKGLYEKVKRRVEESDEFKSVEEYVDFLLNEVVKEEEELKSSTEKDEEKIKQRLKSLGYM